MNDDLPDTFDSMAACAGAMDLSDTVLRIAKERGCPAFRGSRVHRKDLEIWLENHPDIAESIGEEDLLKVDILKERLRGMRIKNDVEAGRYIPKENLAGQLLELGMNQKRVLRAKLEDELPVKLQGLDAAEMKVKLRDVVDELCRIFNESCRKEMEREI